MQPLFEHRRRFGGFETRVLELEGDGPPLVLLHGFADSADSWRVVLDRLGRMDRRAIAVDLPGFATADPLRDGKVLPQLDRFAAAVVSAAAAEGGGDVVVSGNSLGGCVALRATQNEALPIAGVLPIAPAGLGMARWLVLVEREPFLRTVLALPTPVPEVVVRQVVARAYRALAFSHPGDVEPAIVDAFTAHHRDRATVRRYLETGRRLLPELNHERCLQLDRVRCPVLVVWGDRDVMVSPSGAERITAALPDAEVELIEGCGHCPQIEAADRVVALLAGFPEELARAA
jgi:pimeloyl-ACP methyl ester carboxylesterase